jgi:WD40 repeat protein
MKTKVRKMLVVACLGLASGSPLSAQQPKLWATFGGHRGPVWAVAYSPDGKALASGSDDLAIKLWDVKTGKELATLDGHAEWVTSVAYSPTGKTLASGSGDTTIKLWGIPAAK